MSKTPDPVDIHVGERVRMARMEMRKSQGWLGEKLRVSFQQVQKYESGTNRIGPSRLAVIASAVNKPVGWFYEGRPESGAETPTPNIYEMHLKAMRTERAGLDIIAAYGRLPTSLRASFAASMSAVVAELTPGGC